MSSPRIIAGKARGAHLKSVPGEGTRPITDRVKEALFNILGADIRQSDLLDLFAGTGSVGIEALSRGANFVRFIDLNPRAVETIKANLEHTHLAGQADVIRSDAFQFLHRPPDKPFHYIYVAPPQYKGLWLQAISEISEHPGWLTPDAWVIAQIDPVEYQAVSLPNLVEFEQRRYGSTLLVFYERT
jgi:16S rRNA (guanine(966)-N(2))-methyltransferase RsmD